jgi:hypothetical protein
MTTPWQEYKKKLGTTRPWDMLNPNVQHSSKEESATRIAICEECPSLIKITHQCKECGCFMKMKTRLKEAKCPLGKW